MTDLVERYHEARRDPALVVVEGLHALKHALRFGADILDARAVDPAAAVRLAESLAPDVAERVATLLEPVTADTFSSLAPTAHATGVIALAARPEVDVAAVLGETGPAAVVLLDRPRHHGNMGAVVRVAAAAGAAGVLTTGSHDPWHPAAVRGGAGLQFALPVARVDRLPSTDRAVVALDAGGDGELRIPPRSVLVLGSERGGVSPALLERADIRIAIPMRPGVSSLNLATAAAVALYAASTFDATR